MDLYNERLQREQMKARLKAIYAKAFQGLTLDKILLSYEEYVNWCLPKNVIPKDLLGWSLTVKHFRYDQTICTRFQ